MSDARLVKLLSAKVEDLSAECAKLRAELAAAKQAALEQSNLVSDLFKERDNLRADLAARDALLRAELAAALERMSKLDFERTAAELERDTLRAELAAERR